MKIGVIGAGSTYTPELLDGLIKEANTLGLERLYLHDINPKRLQVVGGLGKRMVEYAGNPFSLYTTMNRREALEDAFFVINQIRVGGQKARHRDTSLCLSQGLIGQETVGAAGFAKALRTIPVVLDICQEMERVSPKAWLINFTNPAGIITEAVSKFSQIKVIGLCNCPPVMKGEIGYIFRVKPEEIKLDYMGLNHLGWINSIKVQGQERLGEFLRTKEEIGDKEPSYPQGFLSSLQMYPNPYLKYYYLQEEMLAYLLKKKGSRAEEVMKIQEELLLKYQDPNITAMPEGLAKRGGALYSTAAVSLMVSLLHRDGREHIINIPNQGALIQLPQDAIVEIPVKIKGEGLRGSTQSIPLEIRGLIQEMKAYEGLTVESAVQRDKKKALMALANNPLVLSVKKATSLLESFLLFDGLSYF